MYFLVSFEGEPSDEIFTTEKFPKVSILTLTTYSLISRLIFLSLKYVVNFFSIDSMKHLFCSVNSRLSHSGYEGG